MGGARPPKTWRKKTSHSTRAAPPDRPGSHTSASTTTQAHGLVVLLLRRHTTRQTSAREILCRRHRSLRPLPAGIRLPPPCRLLHSLLTATVAVVRSGKTYSRCTSSKCTLCRTARSTKWGIPSWVLWLGVLRTSLARSATKMLAVVHRLSSPWGCLHLQRRFRALLSSSTRTIRTSWSK